MELKKKSLILMKKLTAIFIIISIITMLFNIPILTIPRVGASSILDSSFTISPLPSYNEYIQKGHDYVKNVTITEYVSKYDTVNQYSNDYRIRIDTPGQLYQVSQLCSDLGKRAHYLSLNYILGNNIDYESYYQSTLNEFVPIGIGNQNDSGDIPFTGTFDGQGFEIVNLRFATDVNTVNINRFFAMFGSNKGTIRNFGLVNPIINTSSVVGNVNVSGIVGKNLTGGTIEFTYVTDNRLKTDDGNWTNDPGYRGENAIFSGLVSLNQTNATISNSYYSGIVSEPEYYVGDNIRPVIMTNNGTLSELYYNKSLYKTSKITQVKTAVAASNKAFVTVSAADADKFAVGQKINIGKYPYSDDIAAEKEIASITTNGTNKNINFSGTVTTAVDNYVSLINYDEAFNPKGAGAVKGIFSLSLETRNGCLTNSKWRTHAYEAIAGNASTLLRATPKLYGFSGYVSSGWGAVANPLEIYTPADLVYFAQFFSTRHTDIIGKTYRLSACIDMSTVAPDAYYFTQFPDASSTFLFTGERRDGDACSDMHCETVEGRTPNHSIINLSMTKKVNGTVRSVNTNLYTNAESIGFIPATSASTAASIKNVNFIGGVCAPTSNPSANIMLAGSIAGFSMMSMDNVHSSMDVIIPDGSTCPFYVGGISGYTQVTVTTNVSYSGKVSGGIHPFNASAPPDLGSQDAKNPTPIYMYSVGGISGGLYGTLGANTTYYTNLLSQGVVEAPGFYNIPLSGGKYTSGVSAIGVLAGGLFGGTLTIGGDRTGRELLSMPLVNKSSIYAVPVKDVGNTPRNGPSGEKVYSLSPSIGGIFAYGVNLWHNDSPYIINHGNIYGFNMAGTSSLAGILGTHFRTSHGWRTDKVVNYGDITVRDSIGNLYASGIQNRFEVVTSSFSSVYNYGDIDVDGSNLLDNCIVGGITAQTALTSNLNVAASDNMYNYGKISVNNVSPSCNIYIGGISGNNTIFGSSVVYSNLLNYGDIEVNTAQTSGEINVSGLAQTTCENSANRGNISVNATGNMTTAINVGGITYTSKNTKTFTNVVNAGNITVLANTSDQVYAGGIFPNTTAIMAVKDCLNIGDISVTNTGTASVGGIGGYLNGSSATYEISDSINSGKITVNAGGGSIATQTGGIVGYAYNKAKLYNCINYGKIDSTTTKTGAVLQYTGGIAGKIAHVGDAKNNIPGFTNGMINFGGVTVNAATTSNANIITGGIVGHYTASAVLNFTNLINHGSVIQNIGSNIGSICGRVEITLSATTVNSYFANHINTVEELNMYGSAAGNNVLSDTVFIRKNLFSAKSNDIGISGSPTAAVPYQGLVQHKTDDKNGIYAQDFEFGIDSLNDCFIYNDIGSLAAARKPDFPNGMYALTTSTGFLSKVYLPETLKLNLIDMPSFDKEASAANEKDNLWRTESRKNFDGSIIPDSDVDASYQFVKQVDNNAVILNMSLESTTHFTLCSNADCKCRSHADELIREHDTDPTDLTNEQMTTFIKDKKILCPNCGKDTLGAVYSEYNFNNIQKRDDSINTLYFYTTENQLGSTFRINGWSTNTGLVAADPDGAPVGKLRFALPYEYDDSIDPQTLDVENKVYIIDEGVSIEYTVKLIFVPNPKMDLVSIRHSDQNSKANNNATLQYKTTKVADLQKQGDTYIVPDPLFYGGTTSHPILSFELTTENISSGFVPHFNTKIMNDETGEDYTTRYVPGANNENKFVFTGPETRFEATYVEGSNPPRYQSGTNKTGIASTTPGNTSLFTTAIDMHVPAGWYTLTITVNNKDLLSIRFYRDVNRFGYPVENDFYSVDMETRTVVRNNSPYGLSSRPEYFYPFGSSARAYDVMLYPIQNLKEKGGAISREGERILTDIRENPDGTHTYINKVAYLPEIAEKMGDPGTTWWTVTTNEGLTGELALKNVRLNDVTHGDGTSFDVITSNDTMENNVKFDGLFTVIDHSNKTDRSSDMYVKFAVKYVTSESTIDMLQIPGSDDYSPTFSLDGKNLLKIEQTKIAASNSSHNTANSTTPSGTYEYTVTLGEDAPKGNYEVYFVYECERQIPLSTFNEETKAYVKNAYNKNVQWKYTFPTPLTIRKPDSSDSYLKSVNFPGAILETIECTTPGHTHPNLAAIDNGVINYSTSVLLGPDRETNFNLNLYFPVGFETAGKRINLQVASGATIYRKVDDENWVQVSPQHIVDYVIGGQYEYKVVSQTGLSTTYYMIKPQGLPRNKKLNIEADKSTGINDLQAFYETNGEDLLISLKQIAIDENGNSQVYEMYNASFIPNNSMHLPCNFPLISSGTYIIDANVPEGYAFDVYKGTEKQILKDNVVSGVKFTIDNVEIAQLVNITVKVSKISQYVTPSGLVKIWYSHLNIAKPAISVDEFDVVFNTSGILFEDIWPAYYPNVIISPRQIRSSKVLGTCFTKGSVTIPEDVVITGDIFAKKDVYVYGKVVGDIHTEGNVHFYGSGNVTGSVFYKN